jgi:hypothetical protein
VKNVVSSSPPKWLLVLNDLRTLFSLSYKNIQKSCSGPKLCANVAMYGVMVIQFDATQSIELNKELSGITDHVCIMLTQINSVQYSQRKKSASVMLWSNNVCLTRICKAMQSLRKLAGSSGWRAGSSLSKSS